MDSSEKPITRLHKPLRVPRVTATLKVLGLLLMIVVFLGGCESKGKDLVTLQGIVLPGRLILITKAPDPLHIQYDLIYIHGIKEELTIGAIMEFQISDQIAESYPLQTQGTSATLISLTSPVIKVPIDHAPRIKSTLGDSAYIVDVREPEEFLHGHLVDSVNSPLRYLEGSAVKPKWDFDLPLLIYARNKEESAQASQWFKEIGYQIVIDLGSLEDFTFELE